MTKIYRKFLIATSTLLIAAMPAQAQIWTDGSGTPLANGTPITISGVINYSLIRFILQTPCTVSMDGTVTSSDTITFTRHTPGFAGWCTLADFGAVEFPFDVKAQFSGASATGKRATAVNVVVNNPIGVCGMIAIPFDWYDSVLSEAQLPTNVSGATCTVHAGSQMRVVAPGSLVGNVDIR